MKRIGTIIQKIVASIIALVLIMSHSAIVGLTAVSYAIDMLATNNNNVEFKAYFEVNGEETSQVEKSIDDETVKLNIDIAVKSEGYFNGQISFENSNFKIKADSTNEYIDKIENNVIYLKQINAETVAKLQVGIESIKDDEINIQTLNGTTKIILSGNYIYSNGNTQIHGEREVSIIWKIPENAYAELSGKVLTNSVYKVGEENKRIVQLLIASRITNNSYPEKSTQITATIPEGAQKVEVHKRTTSATNGNKPFSESNYNMENNLLTIYVENIPQNEIVNWNKNCNDIFIVTYEFAEETNVNNAQMLLNSRIITYDKVPMALQAAQQRINLTDEAKGIVTVDKKEKEEEIYKGKIYAGEEREYTTYTKVYIDYADAIKEVNIKSDESVFTKKQIDEEQKETIVEMPANIQYKEIKLNKENINSILGETWQINITDENNNVNTITNETQADENGIIEIAFSAETKKINIKTSKPVKNGALLLEETKKILETQYTREEIKEFIGIQDKTFAEYTINNDEKDTISKESLITLKETETKARFSVEQQTLTANQEGQELHITAVLEANSENDDLFKNPELRVTLPKEIKATSAETRVIYLNGLEELKQGDLRIENSNNQSIVVLKLKGEQKKYLGEAIDGTTVLLKVPVQVENIENDIEREIVFNYTNENASVYEDNGTKKTKIAIIVPKEEKTVKTDEDDLPRDNNTDNNQDENQQIETIFTATVGNDILKDYDEVSSGEIIRYKVIVKNKGDRTLESLNLEGLVPDGTTYVKVNPIPITIGYEKLSDLDIDEDEYNEEIEGKVVDDFEYYNKLNDKSVISSFNLEPNKSFTLEYEVAVNDEIIDGKNTENTITLKNNNTIIQSKSIKHVLKKKDISMVLLPVHRENSKMIIQSGNTYEYNLRIKNNSNTDVENLKVDLKTNDILNIINITLIKDNEIIESFDDTSTITIDKISANGIAKLRIKAKIDKSNNSSSSTIYATLNSNNLSCRSNMIYEIVEWIKLSVDINSSNPQEYIKPGAEIKYTIDIKNIGNIDVRTLIIENDVSSIMEINKMTMDGNDILNNLYSNDLINYYTEDEEVEEDDSKVIRRMVINRELKAGESVKIVVDATLSSEFETTKDIEISYQVRARAKSFTEESKKIVYKVNANVEAIEKHEFVPEEEEEKEEEEKDSREDTSYVEADSEKNTDETSNTEKDSEKSTDEDKKSEEDANENDNDNGINANKKRYSIKGLAWLDENQNGIKDDNEKMLANIKVYPINAITNKKVLDDNGNEIYAMTNSNGEYDINGIEEGQYLVVFEYNNDIYSVTSYKTKETQEEKNSNVINVEKIIDDEKKNVAITDIIELNKNISYINIGLIEIKDSSLFIEKTISKIIVTNSDGIKEYSYNDTNLAKVEIHSKKIKGSKVVIEYKIKVKNNGSVAGYISDIIDYIPSSLEFNSSLNKEWYTQNKELHNESLKNISIQPKEEKDVILKLTKTMTESNTGLINNKAKLVLVGINEDTTKEQANYMGTADVIISVKTGGVEYHILFIIIIIIELGLVTYRLSKKIQK